MTLKSASQLCDTAGVSVIRGEAPPPPIERVCLDRTFNDYKSRIVLTADLTLAMGEPDSDAPLGVNGMHLALYSLPRHELPRLAAPRDHDARTTGPRARYPTGGRVVLAKVRTASVRF